MERLIANEKKKKSLQIEHQNIDLQIKKKSKALSFDDFEINILKKKKLFIKDEIFKLNTL